MEASIVKLEEPVEALPVVFDRDPIKGIEEAQRIVKAMSDKCQGEKFISNIQGKRYPKVEWWTTVGAVKGLFPYTVSSVRLDREDGEICYESRVEIRNALTGMAVTAAEALCSNRESRWKGRDEYAIKSMSITRATAKAYRIGLSFLAVLAGLEATPAEEVPAEGFQNAPKAPDKATSTSPPKKRNTAGKEPRPPMTQAERARSEKEFRLTEYIAACCSVQNPSKPTPQEKQFMNDKFIAMTGKRKWEDVSDAELDEQLAKKEVQVFESIERGTSGEKY